MIRLPVLVGACVLVASVVGVGALGAASPGAATPGAGTSETTAECAGADSAADRVLVVADAETGERLLEVPVAEGSTVALNYTHSVEKTPVLDVYEVNGTELEMVRMEFHSFGAGLPSRADVNVTDEGTFVFDPDGSYDHIYVKPGEIAGHELLVDDRRYDLVALSEARSVNLYVTNRSSANATISANTTVPATTTELPD